MVFQKPVSSTAAASVLARQHRQQRYNAAAISPRIERTCGDPAFCGSWADDVKHSDPTNKEQINNTSLFGRKCAQLFRCCLGLRRGSRPWGDVIEDRERATPRLLWHVTRSSQLTLMNLTARALLWFLIVSAPTSLVFEAWRRRTAGQSSAFRESDDPGDPSSSATYRGSDTGVVYRGLGSARTAWTGDEKSGVSAIILNWSRFQNVVLIVSGLCDPRLQGVIAEIVVWNNSPRNISPEVSSGSECFTALIVHHACSTLPS